MSDPADVVFVTSRTSGVARRMASVVARLQTRNRGRVTVRVVDADADPQALGRLGVESAPAVVFVREGNAVACVQGRVSLDELEDVLTACEREGYPQTQSGYPEHVTSAETASQDYHREA